jgi:hypothetical protein
MKKLIFYYVFAIIFLFCINSFAQVMHDQKSATIAWDAPAQSTSPDAVVGIMKFQVYTKNNLVETTGTKVGGEITATQLFISPFTPYVNYYVGVESVFYPSATPTVASKSVIAWSTNAADCAGGTTFGFLYKPATNKPGGVRLISMLKEFIDGLPS